MQPQPKALVYPVDATDSMSKAAQRIKDGSLVSFPTETVYGLGANALSPEACTKIFTTKGTYISLFMMHRSSLN